jgi:hypothetical protein
MRQRGRRRGIEHHVLSLSKRIQELQLEGAEAARQLIARAGSERRSERQPYLEREFRRLKAEVSRLEQEAGVVAPLVTQDDVECHVGAIERQLRDVIADRQEWTLESVRGRRRRQSDLRALERMKDEQERLTLELMRCANAMRRHATDAEPPMQRVWKVLRLSGS